MAIDILIVAFVELFQDNALAHQLESVEVVSAFMKALLIVEVGLVRSPYNFDFLMRQNQLYSFLGLTDAILETTTRLDIKGGSSFHMIDA